MQKPEVKPNHPFFSSGPCSKRPGWNLEALSNAFLGRSHRAKNGKAKLNEVIVKSKEFLNLEGLLSTAQAVKDNLNP